MPIPDSIVESVAIDNVKTVAGGPAFYSNLAMGNAVSHQQGMNAILTAAVGSVVKGLTEMDPSEAISISRALTGHDSAQGITALLAALQSGHVGTKVAQTTPPVTP
ncbi:MAG: hypothetical protein EA420_15990 [Candidatus Competibacteraceae bacterium]|nr:MAG: hypothetical protein EA420_15990 [Candidatus Competibacteraceae bacterium]